MNVVYLTHYADLYGANRCLLDLIIEARSKHDVQPHVLLARDGPLTEVLKELHIPWAVIPWQPWVARRLYMGGPHHRMLQAYRHWRSARARSSANATSLPFLVKQCRSWRAELLHVNSSVIGIGPHLERALQIPLVWHIREFFGAHYGYTADGGVSNFRDHLKAADAVIAMSQAVKNEILRVVDGNFAVDVVLDGVVTRAHANVLAAGSKERWNKPRPFHFILAGLFHPSKGQLEAVEALAELRKQGMDAVLTLLGNGEMRPVKEKVQDLGLADHVHMPGFVEDAFPHFLSAHCALTCSKFEAYGRTTLEALTTGIPVIGHDSGGTPELIDHGRTGFLYQTFDQLQEYMKDMVLNIDETQRMGNAAMQGIAGKRDIEVMTSDIMTIYDRTLKRQRTYKRN